MPLVQTRGAASAQGFGEFSQPAVAANYIEDVFSTYLYTGNGSTQTITNGIDLSTKGGLVWMKSRTEGSTKYFGNNVVISSATGLSNAALYTDSSNGFISINPISSLTTSGFVLANESRTNYSGDSFCSWTFREQAKFFDVVTYTGDGTARTIAHNLGSAPGMIIIKKTNSTGNWAVWHRSGTQTNTYVAFLNSVGTYQDQGVNYWGSLTMSSTVFSVGDAADTNASGDSYVAYLFAHDAGGFGTSGTDNVISCGSYTGTGSPVTVTLGYEVQWLLVKRATGATANWILMDVMRGLSYTDAAQLSPNTSGAENNAGVQCNPTATGFQITSTGSNLNSSGATYIYMAIRRPMKVPTTGTSVYQANIYTGNATANTTVAGNFGFPVDLMLLSSRSADSTSWSSYAQMAIDRLRGVAPLLATAATTAESFDWTTYNSFSVPNNIGWGLYGADSGTGYMNNSGGTFVARGFKRASGFFDEVCYTGTGSARTVAHNLTVVPELMIVKARANARNWTVYSVATGNGGHLILNDASAYEANSADWNNTSPTSSVFTVGGNYTVNDLNAGMVAYLFATCAGVSKVGSYTGNGGTQAIACGFTGGARFVLIKRTDATGGWYVYDTARGMTVLTDPYLFLNSTAAEAATLGSVTTTTGGFTVDATVLAAINTNAASYIFLAIA
jgi:hypothetical protein